MKVERLDWRLAVAAGVGLLVSGTEWAQTAPSMGPANSVMAKPSGGGAQGLDFLDKAVWQYQARREWGDSLELVSIMGDRVIVRGNVGGKRPVLALDANNGKVLWEMPDQGQFVIVGELASGTALVNRSGMLQKWVFPEGTVKWQNEFRDFTPLPLIAGSQIITGATTKTFVANGMSVVRDRIVPMDVKALDGNIGQQKWSYLLPEGTANTGRPLLVDGKVVFVAELSKPPGLHCQLIALDATDGKVMYKSAIRDDLLSPPVLVDGELVSLSSKGKVVGLDAKNGEEIWHAAISPDNDAVRSTVSRIPSYVYLESAPVLAGDCILVSVVGETQPPVAPPGQNREDRISGLAAIDRRTHRQLWFCYAPPEMPPPGPGQIAPARVANELWLRTVDAGEGLIVARGVGTKRISMAISQKEGKVLFTLPKSDDSVAISGAMLYVKVEDKLYRVPVAAVLGGK